MTIKTSAPAAHQLKVYVERIEHLNKEIKALNGDKRDLYAEAKLHDINVVALKEIIKIRDQDVNERAARTAVVETYMVALGMLPDNSPAPAPARVQQEILKVKPNEPAWTEDNPADLSIPKSLRRIPASW